MNGDTDKRLTFEHIGRITDQWEHLEFEMARLYSIFMNDPDGESLRVYGAEKTISNRLTIIEAAADRWFVTRPDQEKEGTFLRLARATEGFARRRNEVAHGIVFTVSSFTFFQQMTESPDVEQYAVIPSYHLLKHYNSNGVPKYMHTSETMTALWYDITQLYLDFSDFRKSLGF